MYLLRELMQPTAVAKVVSEATSSKYQSSFHPRDVAASVEEFVKYLKVVGYSLDDGELRDVKYLGFKDGSFIFLMLTHDTNGDELVVSKFFASFDGDAKLTGDFAAKPDKVFDMENEDDAQDMFDNMSNIK